MAQAGCWTHARRGFANLVKLNPGDPVASPIVASSNQLFAVDGEARERGLTWRSITDYGGGRLPHCWSRSKRRSRRHKLELCPVGDWQSPANIPWDNGRDSPVFSSTRS